jgi:hypothetical protein
MSMPDRVKLGIFTWRNLREKANFELLLNAFENLNDLVPTHWALEDSEDPKTKFSPYDHDVLLAEVGSLYDDEDLPVLHRRENPKYQAYLLADDERLNRISIEFSSSVRAVDLPQIFTLGTNLATNLDAELAFVHPIWNGSGREYSAPSVIKVPELQSYGLYSVYVRTWFGPYLANLIGRERLYDCGGYAQDTKWGGIQLDLVENPWQADVEVLSNTQTKVKQNLDSSGVFGDYTKVLEYKAGKNWTPIPQPVKISG